MWPVINSSALISGKFIIKKKSYTRFALNCFAVISFNEKIEFITGHMTYDLAYTEILQTTATLKREIAV